MKVGVHKDLVGKKANFVHDLHLDWKEMQLNAEWSNTIF